MFKKILPIIISLFPLSVLAFELPTSSTGWTTKTISTLLDNIANFLIWAGVVGAIIAFTYAGILYFFSGFNAKSVEKAKELFKNALIGVALVVGFGVIINTVAAVITGNFFGGGNNTNTSTNTTTNNNGVSNVSTGGLGEPCSAGSNCNSAAGLKCNKYSDGETICVRKNGGNQVGENCFGGNDCITGMSCKGAIVNPAANTFVMGVCSTEQ